MGIKRISSRPGLPAGLPFSLGCDTNGACFISGMPALDPDGNLVPGTFAEEADLALRNVIAIAEASGYASDEIVYVQCVLADIADYSTLNDWWRRRFPVRPATSAVYEIVAALARAYGDWPPGLIAASR